MDVENNEFDKMNNQFKAEPGRDSVNSEEPITGESLLYRYILSM